MSNINFSMDYRGIDISGGRGGNIIIPDPFDEINVKTLNIVDDGNLPYYTMPREEVKNDEGSVAVFKPDGSSSLQAYTSPAYLYYQDLTSQSIPATEIQNIILFETGLRTGYNISLINPNSSNSAFRMPIGTYLVNANFNFFYSGLGGVGIPYYGMYVSVNGQELANTRTAPFNDNQNYDPNFPTGFNQIINISSPTDTVQIKFDNRLILNPIARAEIFSLNLTITKIAPNYTTNFLPYFGEFTQPLSYTADNKAYDLTGRPKNRPIDIPYNLINTVNPNKNTQIKQFFDPLFGSYNSIHLIGDPAVGISPYTLQFSGLVEISTFVPTVQIAQVQAFFQSSTNGIDWTTLDPPTILYNNIAGGTTNQVVPICLIKYNFIPNGQNTYIKVIVRLIPIDNIGNIPNSVVVYTNNFNDIYTNSYFAIYNTSTPLPGRARYNQSMNGNGYNGFTRGFEIRQPLIDANTPIPSIENVEIVPNSKTQILLPLVVNNFTPTGDNVFTNVRIVYRDNNMQNFFGAGLTELEFLTPLTNYTITHRFNTILRSPDTSNAPLIRVYMNGSAIITQALPAPAPQFTVFNSVFTYTIPSISVGDKMFLTFEHGTSLCILAFFNNNSITFGY